MDEITYSNWLPDEQYTKAVGQARLRIGGILNPLRMYGQDIYCDHALDQIMLIVERFGMRVRGKDVPICVKENK